MQTRQDLAAAMYAAFTTKTRDDGASFYVLAEGSPEWMHDAVQAGHDAVDALPEDDVYAAIVSAAECLADADEADDAAHEWADGMVDPYNNRRVAWLAASPINRGCLCDEAAEELGTGPDAGIFDRIGLGQYEWNRRIFAAVAEALEEAAADMDDDEDSDD